MSSFDTEVLFCSPSKFQVYSETTSTSGQSDLKVAGALQMLQLFIWKWSGNKFRFTVFVKNLLQAFIIHVVPKVLDVNVSKLLSFGTEFSLPFFARFETTHKPEDRGRAAQAHSWKTGLTKEKKAKNNKPDSISFDFHFPVYKNTGCPGFHVKNDQQKPNPANTRTGTTSTTQIHSYVSSWDSSFLGWTTCTIHWTAVNTTRRRQICRHARQHSGNHLNSWSKTWCGGRWRGMEEQYKRKLRRTKWSYIPCHDDLSPSAIQYCIPAFDPSLKHTSMVIHTHTNTPRWVTSKWTEATENATGRKER